MSTASDGYEDEYEEYEEFDDEDDRGLSGLVVLLMGVVMFAAFASVVFIAYQQGIKTGRNGPDGSIPYVAAEPEPIKIANQTDGVTPTESIEVYDRLEGDGGEPVEILVAGPEEPVSRDVDDAISELASATQTPDDEAGQSDDVIEDQLANLAAADAAFFDQGPPVEETPAPTVIEPTPVSVEPEPAPVAAQPDAISGSHVVQVGAFRSQEEADQFWGGLARRLGDYTAAKASHVERADLGDRGVFYRLRIGPFGSSDEAKTYCQGLKERKQDCLAKAK